MIFLFVLTLYLVIGLAVLGLATGVVHASAWLKCKFQQRQPGMPVRIRRLN